MGVVSCSATEFVSLLAWQILPELFVEILESLMLRYQAACDFKQKYMERTKIVRVRGTLSVWPIRYASEKIIPVSS